MIQETTPLPDVRSWYEGPMTQPRRTSPIGGVDHGSSGRILAEIRSGNDVERRLIWFKGCMVASAGVRGFGHYYSPAHLTIVSGRGYFIAHIAKGGRLNQARLLGLAREIDAGMELVMTKALRIGRTLVTVRENGR